MSFKSLDYNWIAYVINGDKRMNWTKKEVSYIIKLGGIITVLLLTHF